MDNRSADDVSSQGDVQAKAERGLRGSQDMQDPSIKEDPGLSRSVPVKREYEEAFSTMDNIPEFQAPRPRPNPAAQPAEPQQRRSTRQNGHTAANPQSACRPEALAFVSRAQQNILHPPAKVQSTHHNTGAQPASAPPHQLQSNRPPINPVNIQSMPQPAVHPAIPPGTLPQANNSAQQMLAQGDLFPSRSILITNCHVFFNAAPPQPSPHLPPIVSQMAHSQPLHPSANQNRISAPPPGQHYQQPYGQPPLPQSYGQRPPQQGYGRPPPQQGHWQPPPPQGYPPQGQYDALPQQGAAGPSVSQFQNPHQRRGSEAAQEPSSRQVRLAPQEDDCHLSTILAITRQNHPAATFKRKESGPSAFLPTYGIGLGSARLLLAACSEEDVLYQCIPQGITHAICVSHRPLTAVQAWHVPNHIQKAVDQDGRNFRERMYEIFDYLSEAFEEHSTILVYDQSGKTEAPATIIALLIRFGLFPLSKAATSVMDRVEGFQLSELFWRGLIALENDNLLAVKKVRQENRMVSSLLEDEISAAGPRS